MDTGRTDALEAMKQRLRQEMNLIAMERMSAFLMADPRFITGDEVSEIAACGVSREEAMLLLLCAACGVDADAGAMDRVLRDQYFRPSLRRLDAQHYRENAYMKAIAFPDVQAGAWTMTKLEYAPYELFVRDDLLCQGDGRKIPRLGYFDEPFTYPAVLENGREWMTVTPNEIETMQPAVDLACGHVAAMGLGLGYFAFMASEKETVSRVTVIERDENVIELFEKHILPQFPHREKICVIRADAFAFAQNGLAELCADMVFVDLWHDVSDGAPMFLWMKELERFVPGTRFVYWIETSIRAHLRAIGE